MALSGCTPSYNLRYTPDASSVRGMTATQARAELKRLASGRLIHFRPEGGGGHWEYTNCPISKVVFNADSLVLATNDPKCAGEMTYRYDEITQYGVWTFSLGDFWDTKIGEKDTLLFKGNEANARLVSDCLFVLKNASSADRAEIETAPSSVMAARGGNTGSGMLNIAVSDLAAEGVSQSDASIVSDWLRGALVATGTYAVVERSAMQRILSEQAFQQTGCTASDCAVKLGKILNVQRMVVGSFGRFLDSYVVNIRVVDVESGRILYTDSAKGRTTDEIEGRIKALAQRLSK